MAIDQGLAERVRAYLCEHPEFQEKKMFGGLCFMVAGHMCCGVSGDKLMIRVGAESYARYLAKDHVSEMTFTGKPLKGFLYVAPEGLSQDRDLAAWLDICLSLVASLPPKEHDASVGKSGRRAKRPGKAKAHG